MKEKQKIDKPKRVLQQIQKYIGGDLKISKRGVPHLVLGTFSICYFGKRKYIRVFSDYCSAENGKYKDFKTYPELVRHMHFNLKFPYIGEWHLEEA